MRLTVCLEGNTEGKVLASINMEEIVKMTITDDIEKSNFNPQMLKSCTDTSYQCGYEQGRKDAFTQILMYLNDASLAQSGKCYDCTQELMEIIEKMEGEQNEE